MANILKPYGVAVIGLRGRDDEDVTDEVVFMLFRFNAGSGCRRDSAEFFVSGAVLYL